MRYVTHTHIEYRHNVHTSTMSERTTTAWKVLCSNYIPLPSQHVEVSKNVPRIVLKQTKKKSEKRKHLNVNITAAAVTHGYSFTIDPERRELQMGYMCDPPNNCIP